MGIMINRKELQSKYDFLKPTPLREGLLGFGFECGDGWLPLLAKMFKDVDKVLKPEERKYFRFTQIKEKYGGLRAYFNGGSDEVYKIVDCAEEQSYKTCEKCGSTDNVKQTTGWIVSLCPNCMKAYKKERSI